jgi:hypothetical protein
MALLFRVIAFSEEIHGNAHSVCSGPSEARRRISRKALNPKRRLPGWHTAIS